MAGGVSSGLRRLARPYPLFFTGGCGSSVTDVDGNTYIDYGLAWGPLILGHSHPEVVEAVTQQATRAMTFGAQCDLEREVAERLVSVIPCADQVSFASSGTEIVQIALRLARAVTGRPLFLKFEGHYHGWDDSVLVSYRSSAAQLEEADGAPVATGCGQRPGGGAVVAQWNDRASVEAMFARHPGQIAAVICEPMLANSGCIPPEPGFLEFLREISTAQGALLIFDEVITGLRLALDGAQGHYGVTPDLATFAKAIGGGVAFAALGGKQELMDWIADGRVIHAGSLNGNPLVLSAANATVRYLQQHSSEIYPRLWRLGDQLASGLSNILTMAGFPVVTRGGGPVFQIYFHDRTPRNYRETIGADMALYSDFALALLAEGIQVLHDGRWYLSAAHSEDDIARTLDAAARVAAG